MIEVIGYFEPLVAPYIDSWTTFKGTLPTDQGHLGDRGSAGGNPGGHG
jgi:hypothetical protein